jgi:tryptophan halogenase
MSKKISKVVIVGGGSAGWMSAATFVSQFPELEIVVIESPNVPTVGVGESTIGGINDWMNLIGVSDTDFMKDTDASYKLSIRFTDFYRKDAGSFHYPFGTPNTDGNHFAKNDWYFKKMCNPETPVSDYAECIYPNMALVNANKISKNKENKFPGFIFGKDTAYHFDATKFGIWLRDTFSKPKGVKHIQAEVVDVKLNDDGVDYLVLDNGDHVSADLFIDCTGFKSMLLSGALKEPFTSYSDMLPNNSAWATRIPYTNKQEQLVGYTDCHAIENGWVWNIPLWSRIGTGYVYSDKYVSDDDALDEFKNHLISKGNDIEGLEFKNIKMRVGIHDRIWVKNVCAIGLSAGFIEPLESSGLYTVHVFLLLLMRTLSRDLYASQWDRDSFNSSCKYKFRTFAEFVALHYALSHRDDTPYWKDVGTRVYSKELVEQNHVPYVETMIKAVEQRLSHHVYDDNLSGLHCILTGMNYFPADKYSITAHSYPRQTLDQWKTYFQNTVGNLNTKKTLWGLHAINEQSLYDALKEIHEDDLENQ